jgi:hypothetical protein
VKVARILAVLVLLGAGCVSPPAPPKELPGVASRNYDLVWDAAREVVEKHFDLYVQRKDEGYMVSTYKRGEPLPGQYKRDAQTAYDSVEELMHVVRRQLTVRILQDYAGVYVVHIEIIRERQGYAPPKPDASVPYDLYDQDKTSLNETADQKETVTWYRLGRDEYLEKALLEEIQTYLNRHARRG